MRRLGVLVVALLAVTAAPASAASARLEGLAAQLRSRPLAVSDDLAWTMSAGERARLERTLRRADVPLFVAVLPLVREDESGGDGTRVALALQRLVRRPGVYATVDANGGVRAVAYRVRRRLRVGFEEAAGEAGFDEPLRIGSRMAKLSRALDDAPAGGPTTGGAEFLAPVSPVRYPPDRLPALGSDLAGTGALGAVLGLLAGVPFLIRAGVLRRRRRRA